MTPIAKSLPPEFAEADTAYRMLQKDKQNNRVHNLFAVKLGYIWDSYSKHTDEDIQEALFKLWMDSFDHLLADGDIPNYAFADVSVVMDWIIENRLTEKISLTREQEVTLGCLCMTRITMYSLAIDPTPRHDVSYLLKQWTGQEPKRSASQSMEAMVNHLYGPACWSLCHDEVKLLRQLPGYFWKHQLVPSAIKRTKSAPQEAILVPTDMLPDGR